MPTPLISILIPTYNRDEFVFRAIRSVFDVPHADAEVIVVDNASEPAIYDRLAAWVQAQPYSVKLFRNAQNIGMTPNFNACLAHASGEWVGLLCSDDYFKPGALTRLKTILAQQQHPCLIVPDANLDVPMRAYPPGINTLKNIRVLLASGNFWHKDLTAKSGKFDERVKYSPDWEFWYRLAHAHPVTKIRESLAVYENHGQNYMYKTWEQPDFLDQVAQLTHIMAQYEPRPPNEADLDDYIRKGQKDTLMTILQCCCGDSQRNALLSKYLQVAWRCAHSTRERIALCRYPLLHIAMLAHKFFIVATNKKRKRLQHPSP